ncbi:MAG: DUF4350 domain-containing protein [Pedobacter sp.]|nr:MAG: DUF4350 domain-containing protein [Pedobacter sp.]
MRVYELPGSGTWSGKKFEKGNAYIVPSDQPNFRIVHSIFEETAPLNDSLYYDNTSWSIIHAYGLQYAKSATAVGLGAEVTSLPVRPGGVVGSASQLAYVLSWSEYNASRALNFLLENNVVVKAAYKPFTITAAEGAQTFSYGSLVIPVAAQRVGTDSLFSIVKRAGAYAGVNFVPVGTGFSAGGIDLGSNNIKAVRKPTVAIVFGAGTNSEEAGQTWFLLNQQLNLSPTKLDIASLQRAPLTRYNTLILVSGNYAVLDKPVVARIKNWVAEGGTLILFKNAADWAIKQELLNEKLLVDSSDARLKERIDYSSQDVTEAARRINGGVFIADIDTTSPVAFGLNSRRIFFTKNSQTILQPSKNKYGNVAVYDKSSYVGGYVSRKNIAKINNTPAILVSQEGAGKIISFADDPTYRSYWHGTDRLLLNSIFFGYNIQLGGGFQGGKAEAEENHEQ